MKVKIFLFLMLVIPQGFCQNSEANLLLKKSDSLLKTNNIPKAIVILEQLQIRSKDKLMPLYKAKLCSAKAALEASKGNYAGIATHLLKAIPSLNQIPLTPENKKYISDFYSDLYMSYGYTNDWDKALKYQTIGYNFTKKQLPNHDNIVGYVQDLGYIQKQLRNYQQSIVAYEEALVLVNKFFPKELQRIGLIHNGLATAYSDLHFHNQSLHHYRKGLEYHQKSNDVDKSYVVSSSNNLIWETLSYGDYKKAVEILENLNKNFNQYYSEKGFASKTKNGDPIDKQHYKMLKYLSNLRVCTKLQKPQIAKIYLDSIENVLNKMPEPYRLKNFGSTLLGRFYYEDNYYNSTTADSKFIENHISFNKKTLALTKQYNSEHDILVAYLKLAKAYQKYNRYNESLQIIQEAKLQPNNFFNASRFTIQVLEAEVLQQLNQPSQSKIALTNAFKNLLEKPDLKSLASLNYQDFKKFNSDVFIGNVLKSADVTLKRYENNKDKESLCTANALYKIAAEMFQEFYLKGKYNVSLNKFNGQISNGLLQTQLLKNPNDTEAIKGIINTVENNSSQHLWSVFESKSSMNSKIPQAVLSKYNQLVFEKNAILADKNQDSLNQKDKERLRKIEALILQKQREISKVDQSYEQFKDANFALDKAVKQLKSNQLIIKYFVTTNQIFAAAIDRTSCKIIALGNKEAIQRDVNSYANSIKSVSNDFNPLSKKLYNLLLDKIIKNHDSKYLVIIPQDFLSTLSFESLTASNSKVVAQEKIISYAYSIKLWDILQQKKETNSNQNLVSFAPNYQKIPQGSQSRGLVRANLFDLADAKNEAKIISELFNGTLFLNESANRDNFIKSTTQNAIHHLAMHSLLEDDFNKSSLVFSGNQKVYFNELYQLNFPSQMVVLSACNTGIGSQENGEGIMSLSRALTYAGVKSAVYSLWQVPDKETSEIMVSFYENLKDGQAKDEALTNAKKSFLKNNPMKKHPFYWAGFVVNGDVSPIMSSYNYLFYIGIVLGIVVLVIIFRKKLF
jgi:CHAT domain-containing protein